MAPNINDRWSRGIDPRRQNPMFNNVAFPHKSESDTFIMKGGGEMGKENPSMCRGHSIFWNKFMAKYPTLALEKIAKTSTWKAICKD